MSDMIFYTETNFQGTSITLPVHKVLDVFEYGIWAFRSVKVNGNKLFLQSIDAVQENESVIPYRSELFINEDVSDLTVLTNNIENLSGVFAISLPENEIIVSMDVTNKLNNFRTSIDSYVSSLPHINTDCYFNHTQQNIPGVMVFLNPETQLSESTSLTAEATTAKYPEGCQSSYDKLASVTVTYLPESETITLTPDVSVLPYTIEKLSDNHFIVHYEYIVENYDHSFFYDQEEYRGDMSVLSTQFSVNLKDDANNWLYQSASIFSTANLPLFFFTTPYPTDGVGFDFNEFRNLITNTGVDNIPVALNHTSAAVTAVYTSNAVPVFVRLTNTVDAENWEGFVLQSEFITDLIQFNPRDYTSFCMSKPDTQPGLLCIAPYSASKLDYHECNLRYGSLSEDGSTVTWTGDCGLIIENASTDELNVSLLNAPADWEITAVTRGDDGWYVDLSGSAVA